MDSASFFPTRSYIKWPTCKAGGMFPVATLEVEATVHWAISSLLAGDAPSELMTGSIFVDDDGNLIQLWNAWPSTGSDSNKGGLLKSHIDVLRDDEDGNGNGNDLTEPSVFDLTNFGETQSAKGPKGYNFL